MGVMNGLAVGRLCEGLKREGFTPDVMIGHCGWGEVLFVKDVWPSVPLLGYFEFFYRVAGSDMDFDPEFPPASDDPTRIRVGQVLRVKPDESHAVTVNRAKVAAPIEARPLDAPSAAPAAPKEALKDAASEFIWPAKGKLLAGFAEPRSKGIDIDGKPGDPVVAAAAGRVTYTGTGIPGLGKLVVIKHDNGFITVYAHNRSILVKEQQSVARGQRIAELGASDAERPKLHFQIRKGAAAVDPLRYLPAL